jgi:hypothetical protein
MTLTTEPVYLFFSDATVIKVQSLCQAADIEQISIPMFSRCSDQEWSHEGFVELRLVVIADSREVMIDHLMNWLI